MILLRGYPYKPNNTCYTNERVFKAPADNPPVTVCKNITRGICHPAFVFGRHTIQ